MFWIRTKQITVPNAKSLIEEGDPSVIDVRKPEDYALERIDGAIIANRNTVHKDLNEPNKDRPIICYCYSGVSSRVACKNLRQAGFTQVFNLKGGYWAWKRDQNNADK